MSTIMYLNNSCKINNEQYLNGEVALTGTAGQIVEASINPTSSGFVNFGDVVGSTILGLYMTADENLNFIISGQSGSLTGNITANAAWSWGSGVCDNPFASFGNVSGVYVGNTGVGVTGDFQCRILS